MKIVLERVMGKMRRLFKTLFLLWFLVSLVIGEVSPTFVSGQNITAQATENALKDGKFLQSLLEVGQYFDRYGAPTDIAVQGDLAFVASEWGGLLIFNISNSQQPMLLSTFNDERTVSKTSTWVTELTCGVEVIDDLVLLADGWNGLLLINVSNPTEPSLLGKYPRRLYDVKVQENLAYLLCPGIRQVNYGSVIQIVNISNPKQPVLVGEKDNSLIGGHFWDIAVDNSYIYSLSSGHLIIIDATIPQNPEEIVRLQIDASGSVLAFGNYVIATNSSALMVVNVSIPTKPILESVLPLPMTITRTISVFNNTVYLADYDKPKILGINISDVKHPVEIVDIIDYSSIGNCWKALAHQKTAQGTELLFCADYRLGLFCFDVTNKSFPQLLSNFDTNCRAMQLDIEGDFAYVCSRRESPFYPSRLEIISIADVTQPQLLGQYDCINDTIMDVDVSEGYAYLSIAGIGLRILDVHEPTKPVLIGSYSNNATVDFFEKLMFDNATKICYLTHPYYGLLIIDCADPTNPTLLSIFEVWESFYLSSIFIENNIAYIASSGSGGTLALVNISNPLVPSLIIWGTVGDAIADIHVQGDQVYLANQYNFLTIMDFSDISTPVWTGELKNWWFQTQAIFVEGHYAYIAQYATGLRVVDIRNLENPVEVAAMRDHYRGVCYDVFVRDGLIFIADGWDGLEIYELLPPEKVTFLYVLVLFPPSIGFVVVTIIILVQYRRKGREHH